MRLCKTDISILHRVVKNHISEPFTLRVFGSRLDDSKRGGDLDLLIETKKPLVALKRADIQIDLEEKMQLPVDIIFLEDGMKWSPFQQLAYARSEALKFDD